MGEDLYSRGHAAMPGAVAMAMRAYVDEGAEAKEISATYPLN